MQCRPLRDCCGAAHVGEDPRYHLFRYFAIARYLSVGAQVLLSALRI